MKNIKWATLAVLVGSATLFQSGCLGAFWQGLWNTGWPTENRWLNLGIDIANEVIFG